jgi:hypothetical protein
VTRIALLSAVAASLLACADDTGEYNISCADCGDGGYGERPSDGMTVVGRQGIEKRLTQWNARLTIREQPDEREEIELMLGAWDETEDNTFGVFIVSDVQLEHAPFSLVGDHVIGHTLGPGYSGTITMRWQGRRELSSLNAPRAGTLTITEHEAGRIAGTLASELDDGSSVEATFSGKIWAQCQIIADRAGTSFVEVPLDDPFCEPFFR